MYFDLNFRHEVADKIRNAIGEIKRWNAEQPSYVDDIQRLVDRVVPFEHCGKPDRTFLIGGADGSGDFPCVTYGDSFVYLTVADSKLYEALLEGRLKEQSLGDTKVIDFAWMPGGMSKGVSLAAEPLKKAFASMLGTDLEEVCRKSDYYDLAEKYKSRVMVTREELINTLILPQAHEASNLSIQLMSTAEAASLIRLMKYLELSAYAKEKPVYLLQDTTLALPMVKAERTLFFEVVKRYACTLARELGIGYFALSKSPNIPHSVLLEKKIEAKVPGGEHWFLRIPTEEVDGETPEILENRTIPPIGAITYLFKLHKSTEAMRLDMDYGYWSTNIRSENKEEERQREIQLFRDIDFAAHDMRCYGYPYPIKACHDEASLTNGDRQALKSQFIDAAVSDGLDRKYFISPSKKTGHA